MCGCCPHPRAPGALALSLDEAVDFLCFPQKPCTPMLNFFARSGPEIEKIDSLWTGGGIRKGRERRRGARQGARVRLKQIEYQVKTKKSQTRRKRRDGDSCDGQTARFSRGRTATNRHHLAP